MCRSPRIPKSVVLELISSTYVLQRTNYVVHNRLAEVLYLTVYDPVPQKNIRVWFDLHDDQWVYGGRYY